jgi:hypothetical protein
MCADASVIAERRWRRLEAFLRDTLARAPRRGVRAPSPTGQAVARLFTARERCAPRGFL